MLETPYASDVNKILNAKAFARYIDKTQVAYLIQNDHISQRSLHVQLVSRLARELGRELGLDLDLIEAISLGHDMGHPPFGHEGEMLLSELSIEFGAGPFSHPFQSCRLVEWIEPLHLHLEVRDGFLCHDGGMETPVYRPKIGKTEQEHQNELKEKQQDPEIKLWPMSVEGCLVKLCDTVAYLVRDVEDAKIMKLIDEVPESILGTGWSEMLSNFKKDLLKQSRGQKEIVLSEGCFEALLNLRRFNFEKIYFHPKLKVETDRIKRAYRTLFTSLLLDQQERKEQSYIWKEFLMGKPHAYLNSTCDVQRVVDYMAGMTDRYFLLTLNSLITPATIRL